MLLLFVVVMLLTFTGFWCLLSLSLFVGVAVCCDLLLLGSLLFVAVCCWFVLFVVVCCCC